MVLFAHEDADFADSHRVPTFCQAKGHKCCVSEMSSVMKERRGGRRRRVVGAMSRGALSLEKRKMATIEAEIVLWSVGEDQDECC